MQLPRTQDVNIEITSTPDEPTKWDRLASPDMAFMLNECKKTIEERIAFAEAYNNNPTPELQLELVKMNPQAVAGMENPSRDVQMYILTHHEALCHLIKNPIPEIQYQQIAQDPRSILTIENPSNEAINVALAKDGSLIEYFKDATEDQYIIAVTNSGVAINLIPEEKQTHDVQMKAVLNTPKALQYIKQPQDDVIIEALRHEPGLINILENPSQEVKLFAIQQNPAVVLDLKNPWDHVEDINVHNQKIHDLWAAAISLNGYLIRNCGKAFPDLREPAIQQNPFAVTCIKDATHEEIDLALSINPQIAIFLKKDEDILYAQERIQECYGADHVPVKNIYHAIESAEMELE